MNILISLFLIGFGVIVIVFREQMVDANIKRAQKGTGFINERQKNYPRSASIVIAGIVGVFMVFVGLIELFTK